MTDAGTTAAGTTGAASAQTTGTTTGAVTTGTPLRACCVNATCTLLLPEDCIAYAGTPLDATTCDDNECPRDLGACCVVCTYNTTSEFGAVEVVERTCLNSTTAWYCTLFSSFPCGPNVTNTFETQFFPGTTCSAIADICPVRNNTEETGTTGATTGAGGYGTTGTATATTASVTEDMTSTGGSDTTTGVPTTGRATTGLATSTTGVSTTGRVTTGVSTTGRVTTGQATTTTTGRVSTTGRVTTGQATTGRVTTGVATTGRVTTGVPTTGVATTGRATTGVATTGVATTGSATTGQTPPTECGDGVISLGEECDDGNTADGDGCSALCTVEYFERDYACGIGCLDTTIITASVPLLHTNTITYAFNKTTGATCNVSHFVLFDIPACTDVVRVTSYPPRCATHVAVPCATAGDDKCDHVGPCRDDWADMIGRPMKVDVWGNNCSVTVEFAHNLTFAEAPFGLKGGQSCSDCVVLVPAGCYEPPQIFPEAACWWDYGNTTCAGVYNYSLVGAEIAIVPKGPRNFIAPGALPGTDNTPVVFAHSGQMVGHSVYWDCAASATHTWEVDGQAATVSTLRAGKICNDCNNNSIPDPVDIERRTSADCNHDCIPDECEIAADPSLDNNTNGVLDVCEMPGMAEPAPPGERPPWEPGVITVIVALALCVIVGCCALFVKRDDDDDDDDTEGADSPRRAVGEGRRLDPLWADANISLLPQRGAGGRRGPIGLGMGARSDTDQSETDGHRKKR